MKIRQGFVSNSSSSSFLIYGTTIDSDDMEKILKNSNVEMEKFDEESMDKHEYDYESYEVLGELLEKNDLVCDIIDSDFSNIYVGASWCTVKNDETGLQFKTRVKDTLEKLLGKKIACSTMQEAWRDG